MDKSKPSNILTKAILFGQNKSFDDRTLSNHEDTDKKTIIVTNTNF